MIRQYLSSNLLNQTKILRLGIKTLKKMMMVFKKLLLKIMVHLPFSLKYWPRQKAYLIIPKQVTLLPNLHSLRFCKKITLKHKSKLKLSSKKLTSYRTISHWLLNSLSLKTSSKHSRISWTEKFSLRCLILAYLANKVPTMNWWKPLRTLNSLKRWTLMNCLITIGSIY